MKNVLNIIFILFFSVLMASCASSGKIIEQSNVEKIVIGETSKKDMVNMFGSPLSQSFGTDGKLSMIWYYVYVGPFGIGMKQQNLAVLFDGNEVVEKYNLIDGATNGVRFGR